MTTQIIAGFMLVLLLISNNGLVVFVSAPNDRALQKMYYIGGERIDSNNKKVDLVRYLKSALSPAKRLPQFLDNVWQNDEKEKSRNKNTSKSRKILNTSLDQMHNYFQPSKSDSQCDKTITYRSHNGSFEWNSTLCSHSCQERMCFFILEIPQPNFTIVLEFDIVSFNYTNSGRFKDYLQIECEPINLLITGKLPVAPVWCRNHRAYLFLKNRGFHPSSLKIRYYSNVLHVCRAGADNSLHSIFSKHICKSNALVSCDPSTQLTYSSKPDRIIYAGANALPTVFRCNNITEMTCGKYSYDENDCIENDCGKYALSFGNECYIVRSYKPPNRIECVGKFKNPGFLSPSVRNFIQKKVSASRIHYDKDSTIIDNSHKILTGVQRIKTENSHLDYLYKYMWWWKDYKVIVHDMLPYRYGSRFASGKDEQYYDVRAMLEIYPSGDMSMHPSRNEWTLRVCHTYNSQRQHMFRSTKLKHSHRMLEKPVKFPTQHCQGGHYRHQFHPCESGSLMKARVRHNRLPMFQCENGLLVHYTLTCDGVDNCNDNSDEVNCALVRKWLVENAQNFSDDSIFICSKTIELIKGHIELIKGHFRCDGKSDCFDGSDEYSCHKCRSNNTIRISKKKEVCLQSLEMCPNAKHPSHQVRFSQISNSTIAVVKDNMKSNRFIYPENTYALLDDMKPWAVHLDGCGGSYLTLLNDTENCPETHVRCPDAYCIPSYMLNNGVYDCPHLETDDEYVGSDFACPGQYRCYKSHICVHNTYLCDGVYHCPLKDDERYCNISCPDNCSCEGYAMKCTDMINPLENFNVRYLDISGVNLSGNPKVNQLHYLPFLHFLNTSGCSLLTLDISSLSIIQILDISGNKFRNLSYLRFPNKHDITLKRLYMSGNPMFFSVQTGLTEILCQTGTSLQVLNIDSTGLTALSFGKTYCNSSLQKLRLTQNLIEIASGSFMGLNKLQVLETSNERLCCLFYITHPKSKVDCIAPENELSSCDDLLQSNFLRVFLWLQAIAALLGNGGVLVKRIFCERQHESFGYHFLVTNLCISDFIMGLYLIIIGSADLYYRGEYLWHGDTWMHSIPCTVAGVLAMVSSEVSAFIICLITVDRLLVVRFPLKRYLHLTWKSALALSGAAWTVGVTLAVVPLLPVHKDWEFYSQNGICLPLPITRQQFPGHGYTFSIFLVLNFVLFLFVGFGQLAIYFFISSTPVAGRSSARQQEFTIARRLFLIVFTDFLCWFPVGVMGLLAKTGTSIPGEVNVWTAVFVLPLNSAINPFLYTFNALQHKQDKKREREQLQNLVKRFEVEISTFSEEKIEILKNVIHKQQTNARYSPRELPNLSVTNQLQPLK